MDQVWLSKEVLSWEPQATSSHVFDQLTWHRAYKIWNHAKEIGLSQKSEFHNVDIITTLKRAINHRLKQFDSNYPFKKLFHNSKPKRLLDQLAYFNIVRPFMVERLMIIRNEIEHEDCLPPDHERCLEFIDLTWYFLRSTDKLIAEPITNFSLVKNMTINSYYNIWFKVKENHSGFEIGCWVPPSLIAYIPNPGFLPIMADNICTREQSIDRLEKEGFKTYGVHP